MPLKPYDSGSTVPRANRIKYRLASIVLATFALASVSAVAQEAPQESTGKDRYRVELLLFTIKNPSEQEYMGQAQAPVPPIGAELLYGQVPAGAVEPEIGAGDDAPAVEPEVEDFSKTLLDTQNLHLSAARNRLQSSGRYNVEFLVAWNEAFPPGHKTPPLLVYVGDTTEEYSDVQGYIQIDRQRYLHVNAQLYDLDLTSIESPDPGPANRSAVNQPIANGDGNPILDPFVLDAFSLNGAEQARDIGPEVVAWLRENRRMRSGEVHLLDSPTMGLLVYFEPLD